jgi:hypothetical protein
MRGVGVWLEGTNKLISAGSLLIASSPIQSKSKGGRKD